MPKRKVTSENIEQTLRDARVNRRSSKDSREKLADDIRNKGLNADLDKRPTIFNDSLVLSNRESVNTTLEFDNTREYYSQESFENNFDVELTELITKAPEPEPDPVPEVRKPPAPSLIQIQGTNNHWTLDGKLGRRDKDTNSWQNNYHPEGNNPGGGYLYIPDDHPLFYLRKCEPKNARASFNYEWKVNGEVVSDKPFLQLYNIDDQGKKDEGDDKSRWRNQDDIIIECRVWNESGQLKADTKMRCARDVRNENELEADEVTGKPRWKWKGYREFKEEVFMNGDYRVLTDYIQDPKYKQRNIVVKEFDIFDFNKDAFTTPSRYEAKPWSKKQLINVSQQLARPPFVPKDDFPSPQEIDKLRKEANQGNETSAKELRKMGFKLGQRNYDEYETAILNDAEEAKRNAEDYDRYVRTNKNLINERAKNFKDDHDSLINKICRPYTKDDSFIGRVYEKGKWVTFKEFWSGYDVKDPYDLKNFMRTNAKGELDPEGSTAMERVNKPFQVSARPGDEAVLGFVFGYAKTLKDSKKVFKLYSKIYRRRIKEDDGDQIDVVLKPRIEEITYYGKNDNATKFLSEEIKRAKKFTPSFIAGQKKKIATAKVKELLDRTGRFLGSRSNRRRNRPRGY
tara:strand:- start:1414 stop:3291 length:1878 start_codon:yes stop_codon:yes gene_type:complete